MTATSEAIIRRLTTNWSDWYVSDADAADILRLLRVDPEMPATVRDLRAAGKLINLLPLFRRPDGAALAQVLGSGSGTAQGAEVLAHPGFPRFRRTDFQLSLQAHERFRIMGAEFAASSFSAGSLQTVIGPNPTSPFRGVGATGVSPTQRSIPLTDQARMAAGNESVLSRYRNPIPGSLSAYLAGLTALNDVGRRCCSFVGRSSVSFLIPTVAVSRHASQ